LWKILGRKPAVQRWPESFFQTLTPFLFQNFWIPIRVRKFFKFDDPTPVQNPASIDPNEIYLWFYFRNDRADCCYCPIWKLTEDPVSVFQNFWLQIQVWKNAESCRSRLLHFGSMATSTSGFFQRWPWIQSFLRTRIPALSQNFVKNWTGSGVTFQLQQ